MNEHNLPEMHSVDKLYTNMRKKFQYIVYKYCVAISVTPYIHAAQNFPSITVNRSSFQTISMNEIMSVKILSRVVAFLL